jgi:UDP-N-acetyl-D-galactosamine dehydrogenase
MFEVYDSLITKKEKLSVVGLGYVGIQLAVAFSKKFDVIGFDVSGEKIEKYKRGIDPTKEVGDDALVNCSVDFTCDETRLKEAKLHIVSVPTPISKDNRPDFSFIITASQMIGRSLTKNSFVVYESTTYPGAAEEICIPVLEEESGLTCGVDFKIGYSPERINPGDKTNQLESIVKIVAGGDKKSLEEITKIYQSIIKAGVHPVSSIKIAEAAKVAENAQRDLNIAFMNELAMVFDRMDIDTTQVIEAMDTKWNALGFHPGLVGGHCISVDPYYLAYEAERLNYNSQLILSSRRINESMSVFVKDSIIKELILANKKVKEVKVAFLGVTYKENCPDIRNSKIVDIMDHLHPYGVNPLVVDPVACPIEVKRELAIDLVSLGELSNLDCLVLAVTHDIFRSLTIEELKPLFGDFPRDEKVIIDIRGLLNMDEVTNHGFRYWRI